jgi:hypothetical protein
VKDITRGITNRDVRAVVKQAIAAGCDARLTGGNHVQLRVPNGGIVVVGTTQPAARTIRNLHSQLRRAGLDIK